MSDSTAHAPALAPQIQSGQFAGQSYAQVMAGLARSGTLFRGVVPGLVRSTFANGLGMVALNDVKRRMAEWREKK